MSSDKWIKAWKAMKIKILAVSAMVFALCVSAEARQQEKFIV